MPYKVVVTSRYSGFLYLNFCLDSLSILRVCLALEWPRLSALDSSPSRALIFPISGAPGISYLDPKPTSRPCPFKGELTNQKAVLIEPAVYRGLVDLGGTWESKLSIPLAVLEIFPVFFHQAERLVILKAHRRP